jgi:hypothetical protein
MELKTIQIPAFCIGLFILALLALFEMKFLGEEKGSVWENEELGK